MQETVDLPLDEAGAPADTQQSSNGAAPPTAADDPQRPAFIGFALLGGLLIGVIGNALFYGKLIGLSFPLFVAICVGAALLALRIRKTAPRVSNAFLIAPLLFCAIMVAVRADSNMTSINGLAVLWLGALAVYYLPLRRQFDLESFGTQAGAVVQTGLILTALPLIEADTGLSWLRCRIWANRTNVGAVVRGFVLMGIVVGGFALLLASADQVFDDLLARIATLFDIPVPADLITQFVVIFILAWASFGALVLLGARRTLIMMDGDEDAPEPAKKRAMTLSMIETGMVLGGVVALFAVFVAIQFAYFFGGEAALADTNLTYAEYARRGYFELAMVAALSIALLLFLDHSTIKQGAGRRLFLALASAVLALNSVMLVSAWLRLDLYEQAYGFTHLRVAVQVSLVWAGVIFAGTLAHLVRLRRAVFSLSVFTAITAMIVTLNLMNLDLYTAQRNIERAQQGSRLDLVYLWRLSADAAPAIIDLYQSTNDPVRREFAAQWLLREYTRAQRIRSTSDTPLFATVLSAHWGRDTAYAAISAIADTLPEYDGRYYPPSVYD